MVDPRIEDQLREFLGREKRAEEEGYTRKAVLKAVDTVGQALQAHQRECQERWEKNEERHRSADLRLRTLEAARQQVVAAAAAPLPRASLSDVDPSEITSSHRIDAIADKVRQVTMESLRVPGTDPEEAVRKVVVEEQEALGRRTELKRLQKKEEDELKAKEVEAKERRERNRLIVASVASTLLGAGVLWVVQLLASHVH
jgi:hypothetical protein